VYRAVKIKRVAQSYTVQHEISLGLN